MKPSKICSLQMCSPCMSPLHFANRLLYYQRFCQLEAIPQVNMTLGSCVLSYLVTIDKTDIKEPSLLCFLLWVLCLQSQVKVLNVQLAFIYSVVVKFPCVYGNVQFFQHHCWKKSFSPLFIVEGGGFCPISINSTCVSSIFELLFHWPMCLFSSIIQVWLR